MQIKGTLKQLIFTSENGYVVALFKLKDNKEFDNNMITITGYFANVNENENYLLEGEITNHPKYGQQFSVTSYEIIKPEDKDGLIEFLASGLFKGIGEKLAKRIVDYLGENAIELILEDKNNLLSVPKLTAKKAQIIYDTLTLYEESHKIIIELTNMGFTNKDALNIYNFYKNNTLNVINNNIYKIVDDIKGIGFLKVDKIATSKNINLLADNRLEACIYYIMENLTYKNGDTYLNYEEIKFSLLEYLGFDLDDDTINTLINNLINEMKIIVIDNKYYLYEIYEAEYNIVNKIRHLVNKKKDNYRNIDKYIKELEKNNGIIYNDNQKQAIKASLNNNITIITGGPGVGKTTIIKAIVEIYKKVNKLDDMKLNNKLALLAPTGRASKRMCENSGYKALTIHRFLKWNKDTNEFLINEYNKDFSHLIIVDEASMIDINLLNNLFLGLLDNIKIIFVGDYNQLPSVGPGEILKDLIESEVIETIKLEKLYRQSDESYIPILSKQINNNELENCFSNYDDYMFVNCLNNNIINTLKTLSQKLIDKGYNYFNTQIMAPMYAGVVGIDNLNKVLQDVFNPFSENKKELKYNDQIFRVNDKVLQLQNMPDLNVFNGDIGIIKDITDNREVVIDFDSNIVNYKPADLVNIKHGYVISIHKSQGSEFKMVIMILSNQHHRLLYRKLIYTGVTRAKEKLIIIGQDEAFITGVLNNNYYLRKTLLKEKLIECINT